MYDLFQHFYKHVKNAIGGRPTDSVNTVRGCNVLSHEILRIYDTFGTSIPVPFSLRTRCRELYRLITPENDGSLPNQEEHVTFQEYLGFKNPFHNAYADGSDDDDDKGYIPCVGFSNIPLLLHLVCILVDKNVLSYHVKSYTHWKPLSRYNGSMGTTSWDRLAPIYYDTANKYPNKEGLGLRDLCRYIVFGTMPDDQVKKGYNFQKSGFHDRVSQALAGITKCQLYASMQKRTTNIAPVITPPLIAAKTKKASTPTPSKKSSPRKKTVTSSSPDPTPPPNQPPQDFLQQLITVKEIVSMPKYTGGISPMHTVQFMRAWADVQARMYRTIHLFARLKHPKDPVASLAVEKQCVQGVLAFKEPYSTYLSTYMLNMALFKNYRFKSTFHSSTMGPLYEKNMTWPAFLAKILNPDRFGTWVEKWPTCVVWNENATPSNVSML